MTKEYFYKLIEHELEWLRYYSTRESKSRLNINSDIYKDLKQMNYVKRIINLDIRCSPCLITSDKPITIETKIENLKQIEFPRKGTENNRFTPLETLFIIHPEKKQEYLNKLIPEPIDMTPPKEIRKEGKYRIRIQ